MNISVELLKLRRKELNLNQNDVANKIGVCRSQYANIEAGRTNPSIQALIKLLKLYNITFEELYKLKMSKRLIKIKNQRIKQLQNEIEILNTQPQTA